VTRCPTIVLTLTLLAPLAGCRTSKLATEPRETAQALLAAGHDLAPPGSEEDNDSWAAAELGRIAARVRAERQRDPALTPAAALNRTVFEVLGFVREVDDPDLRFVLLPSVLRQHRGGCVGLGLLYLALASLLDVPASGVVVPGHFFVRIDEHGRARNVELLRQGEEMPAAWYQTRYPVAGRGAAAYGRALTVDEVVGVVAYNVGQQWRRQSRLEEAKRAFQRATLNFPGLPEAQASLGATLHLLGALEPAAAAYAAAEHAYPDLPGLKNNRQLLDQERASAPAIKP
jgi:regulator of sirC expression with transglutaminase-like and TPR domain